MRSDGHATVRRHRWEVQLANRVPETDAHGFYNGFLSRPAPVERHQVVRSGKSSEVIAFRRPHDFLNK